MRRFCAFIAAAALCCAASSAESEPYVRMGAPMLAPLSHSVFCLKYPEECACPKGPKKCWEVRLDVVRVALTPAHRAELLEVNKRVNAAIVPKANTEGIAGEKWLIAPKSGECYDYAVTKRHELLERGWPMSALLLAEVVVSWGDHHLVLVVATDRGDFVLDNLDARVRLWSQAPYEWVRIESPKTPVFWQKVVAQ